MKAQLERARDKFALPPEAIARAIMFAIEQPRDVDVGETIPVPLRRVNSAASSRTI